MYYYDHTPSFDPIQAPLYAPRSLDITFKVHIMLLGVLEKWKYNIVLLTYTWLQSAQQIDYKIIVIVLTKGQLQIPWMVHTPKDKYNLKDIISVVKRPLKPIQWLYYISISWL